ncbi:DUF2975 domain-containing protein [Anaerocolumna sp. MB42-C2]|uniref:DUF2975 domain-containing protein n=1 Tax=Anaerocolumna sp. MB42-C2 TaxID=3070997 RepID=UPI0027E18295|nr:DUF2975 domain-containing protein [Anaerocolumna sp. MB42-C2]WMJ90641.1 DUF2975 domain-containing protein [Anaerocolumna sp. MB42-C2]
MKQQEMTNWLKGICIGITVMGLIFFGLLIPELAVESRKQYPEVAFLFWPGLIYVWVIGALSYAILYQFWKVCIQIGKDNSFSLENSRSFVIISKLGVVISAICFLGMVYLGINKWLNPGVMFLMIGVIFIGIIITVLAAALSRLILKAYELKKENELTI